MKYLLNKPHQYLLVWSFLYANSNEEGVYSDNYQYLLSQFSLSRSSLQRIVDYGCSYEQDGQKMGRIWAGKELKIIFFKEIGGQNLGRIWAEEHHDADQGSDNQQSSQKSSSSGRKKKVKQESATVYSEMVREYDSFCTNQTGMGAKMDALQGKSMKEIIKYLRTQVINKKGQLEEPVLNNEIVSAWQFVLANWSMVDDFYSKQIKLNQINSNLPNILTQLRNNKKKLRNERFASTVQQVEGINFDEAQS